MCLQVPLKVEKVQDKYILVEGGRKLLYKLDKPVYAGDYVWAFGNLVVSQISKKKAKDIRSKFKKQV